MIDRRKVQELLDDTNHEIAAIMGKNLPTIYLVLTSRAEALRDVLALES